MSECCGPQTGNTHEDQQLCSVGKTCPGFHTKIAEPESGGSKGTDTTNKVTCI